MKFTEEKLELAFIELLDKQDIKHQSCKDIQRDKKTTCKNFLQVQKVKVYG